MWTVVLLVAAVGTTLLLDRFYDMPVRGALTRAWRRRRAAAA